MAGATADKDAVFRRQWLPNSETPTNGTLIRRPGFTVVSYNILADCYWGSLEKSYPYCPNGYRTATERLPQLMRELQHHDADIICLQEVSVELYTNNLKPKLTTMGYHGTHCKRAHYPEGVATFFKTNRFDLEDEKRLHTHDLIVKALENADACRDLINAVISHPYYQRAVILSRLKCKQTNHIVSVGNLHLSWNTEHQDRILLEVAMVTNELIVFAGGADKPHILCGDFNQEPWLPGYELLQNGVVSQNSINQMKMHTLPEVCENEEKSAFLVDRLPDRVKHNSKDLRSAYKSIMGDEPPFTCHCHEDCNMETNRWPAPQSVDNGALELQRKPSSGKCYSSNSVPNNDLNSDIKTNYDNFVNSSGDELYIATLDYLWYSSNTLHCQGVLKLINESEIALFYSTPNEVFPSDHLLMKAAFDFL